MQLPRQVYPRFSSWDRVGQGRRPLQLWYVAISRLNVYGNTHNKLTASQTERSTVAQTHTSTTPLTVSALLPEPHVPASSHFRSPGDPAFERARQLLLLDTPGHGKLRHFATSELADPKNIRGIVFVVDAAAIAEEAGLNEAAEYLHDVLLALQKRYTGAKTSKAPKEIHVLIAANKSDLFTALPANLVKIQLQKTIGEVRTRRAKALRDAGAALTGGDDEGR